MIFIHRHITPEYFIQINQNLFELWSLAANILPGLGYKIDSCGMYKDNFVFRYICAQKISTYDLHTYAHNLSRFEIILTKTFGIRYFWIVTTDAHKLQNIILFNRVEQ